MYPFFFLLVLEIIEVLWVRVEDENTRAVLVHVFVFTPLWLPLLFAAEFGVTVDGKGHTFAADSARVGASAKNTLVCAKNAFIV